MRVGIDQEDFDFRGGECSGEINGGSCFADSAFLICDRDDARQDSAMLTRPVRGDHVPRETLDFGGEKREVYRTNSVELSSTWNIGPCSAASQRMLK